MVFDGAQLTILCHRRGSIGPAPRASCWCHWSLDQCAACAATNCRALVKAGGGSVKDRSFGSTDISTAEVGWVLVLSLFLPLDFLEFPSTGVNSVSSKERLGGGLDEDDPFGSWRRAGRDTECEASDDVEGCESGLVTEGLVEEEAWGGWARGCGSCCVAVGLVEGGAWGG